MRTGSRKIVANVWTDEAREAAAEARRANSGGKSEATDYAPKGGHPKDAGILREDARQAAWEVKEHDTDMIMKDEAGKLRSQDYEKAARLHSKASKAHLLSGDKEKADWHKAQAETYRWAKKRGLR